ncbi:MAG: helix-hairpin-helix domain-containing protein [Candidatus Omnitrophota bacterium]
MKNLRGQFLYQYPHEAGPKEDFGPVCVIAGTPTLRRGAKQSLRGLRLLRSFRARNDTEKRPFGIVSHKRGTLLIVSVWILVFFSILSAGLYKIVSAQIRLTKTIEQRFISQYLAKAAVVYAQVKKAQDDIPYDTLYELAQENQQELSKGKFVYTIIDEERKININIASLDEITRLPGLNPELAQKIFSSTLRPFALKEELLLVDGISEEIYDGLKDFITIYTEGRVNINTAPAEVLLALGFDDSLITKIEDFRAGQDKEEATEDDEVFESTAEILDKLRVYTPLTAQQEAFILTLLGKGVLTVSSVNLGLQINTLILDKPAMKYIVLIKGEMIKRWIE